MPCRDKEACDSSVGIATGLRAGQSGVVGLNFQWGLGFFVLITASRPALSPTQPPIPGVLGPLSLGVKRPWREADHSPPSSAEVKNAWSYTSIVNVGTTLHCIHAHTHMHRERERYIFVPTGSEQRWKQISRDNYENCTLLKQFISEELALLQ
jgi:hypothetical protein